MCGMGFAFGVVVGGSIARRPRLQHMFGPLLSQMCSSVQLACVCCVGPDGMRPGCAGTCTVPFWGLVSHVSNVSLYCVLVSAGRTHRLPYVFICPGVFGGVGCAAHHCAARPCTSLSCGHVLYHHVMPRFLAPAVTTDEFIGEQQSASGLQLRCVTRWVHQKAADWLADDLCDQV